MWQRTTVGWNADVGLAQFRATARWLERVQYVIHVMSRAACSFRNVVQPSTSNGWPMWTEKGIGIQTQLTRPLKRYTCIYVQEFTFRSLAFAGSVMPNIRWCRRNRKVCRAVWKCIAFILCRWVMMGGCKLILRRCNRPEDLLYVEMMEGIPFESDWWSLCKMLLICFPLLEKIFKLSANMYKPPHMLRTHRKQPHTLSPPKNRTIKY